MREHKRNEDVEFEEEGLDIVDLIFTVIRRWKIIVLIAIPIICFGIFKASTRPTIYRADVTLMMTNPNMVETIGASDLYINDKLILTYVQLIKSKDIMVRVINKFDLSDSPAALASRVGLTSINGTAFMKLSYTSGEKDLTAPVANEIANEFIYKIAQVVKLRNVNILENAVGAYELPKNREKIIILSILLGLVMGCGVALIVELVYRKLRKASEIEKILGVKMLGMIPEVNMQAEGEENYES